MSTIRGRAVKVGGMVADAGATARTDASQVVRPAFRFSAGWRQPVAPPSTGLGGASGHPLFDVNSVTFWRHVIAALAFAYIVGFHVSLNGFKLGVGPGKMGG
jgi:hypothetical protein